MSYEKYEKFKAELSQADYRSYISQVWWVVDYYFSEWWNSIECENKKTQIELKVLYDNITVSSIALWILIKDYVRKGKKENLNGFTEKILKLPTLKEKDKEEVKDIILKLAAYISRLVPLSESTSGTGLPE